MLLYTYNLLHFKIYITKERYLHVQIPYFAVFPRHIHGTGPSQFYLEC